MKVTIIGGGGLVGSCTAFALQCGGVARELALIDMNRDAATGHALDLLHGSTLAADQAIRAGGYEDVSGSDVVIITAGSRRNPAESRLDLVHRNVTLFRSILSELKRARLKSDASVIVVSNPVDVLTDLAVRELGLPPERVIGLGTMLDTIRFRSLIAWGLNLPATQVAALVLGEHGDSMVPIWSSATIGGLPLEKWPGVNPAWQQSIASRTRGSGAEVIKLKGGAGFAVALAIREVAHSILLDQRRILPVSTMQTGLYGVRDICLSVPTIIGRSGVIGHVVANLWPRELQGIEQSARVLRQTIGEVPQSCT